MKNSYMISMVIGISLFSCTPMSTEEDKPIKTTEEVAATDSLLTVEEGGYELSITVPKALLKDDSSLSYRSSFGDVELYVDPKFHLYITDEQLSLATVKEELEQDDLFSRKFYNEASDELLYQSILPDGTEMGFQWIKKISLNDQSFILKTDPQGDFSRQQIRNIQECCKSIQTL